MKYGKLFALAIAALPLAGCVEDEIVQPIERGVGGELFDRYVALGTSITAGFQSLGINDSTQLQAYPVLVAKQAGADFVVPLFNKPGCPPPFTAPLGVTGRLGDRPGAPAPVCSLRTTTAPQVIQNLGVPGAEIGNAFDVLSEPNPGDFFNRTQTLILGGRTIVQALADANPTLVSVEFAADILGAVQNGNPADLTSVTSYGASLDKLVAAIRATGAKDAILIAGFNPKFFALTQPGAYYFLSRDANGLFLGKPVNNNCAPTSLGGQNLVSLEMVGDASFPEINCSNEAFPVGDARRGRFVLTPAELATIVARAEAFNALLKAQAQQNNWIYLDVNPVLDRLADERDAQGRFQRLRKCQALPAALATGNPAAIQAALLTSCPVPNSGATAAFAAPNFFGSMISLDGVHPSAQFHAVVANEIIEAVNAKYSLGIPKVSIPVIS